METQVEVWEMFDSFTGETPTGVHFLILHEATKAAPDADYQHRISVAGCPDGWPSAQTFTGPRAWELACAQFVDLKDFLLWSEHPDCCQ
jgi:hypothetical protein